MNRMGIIGSIIISIICLTGIILYSQQSQPIKESVQYVTLKEASSEYNTVSLITDGDTLFYSNSLEDTIEPIEKINGSILEALDLEGTYAISKYEYLDDSQMIDPTSLDIDIISSIPITYTSSLHNSSVFIETLKYDGWDIKAVFRNVEYIDIYLEKSNNFSRIIITKNSLKIFQETKGKIPDLISYIIDRKVGY